eukprot:COSAG05_NODE_19756_length_288_cov_0.804233_1_plen_69_part_01
MSARLGQAPTDLNTTPEKLPVDEGDTPPRGPTQGHLQRDDKGFSPAPAEAVAERVSPRGQPKPGTVAAG